MSEVIGLIGRVAIVEIGEVTKYRDAQPGEGRDDPGQFRARNRRNRERHAPTCLSQSCKL